MAIKGMGGIGRFSRSLALGASLATGRFPVAALAIVMVSVLANLAVRDIYPFTEEQVIRLVLALHAAAAAAVCLRLAAESRRWSRAAQMLAPLGAGLIAGLAIWTAVPLWLLAPPLLTALTLAIPLAPYVGRPDDARFWTFTLWAFVGATLAFLSVLLFVLGVSAILEMIRYLFDIGLSTDAYEHIYATALTLVGPLFALGRIPTDFDEVTTTGTDDRLAQGVRFLFDWVATPLALVTAIVLHLYAAKILFGAVPKNEIGWIVSFYAVLVLSIRVVIDPFAETGAPTTKLFGRIWAFMLLVPLGLLVYAVGVRILAEGYTLERYYLALATLTAVLVVLVQAVPRWRGDIRLMCGLPLLLLALSSFGPWGAGATVGRSQTAMIESALLGPRAPRPLEAPAQAELRSRLYALGEVGELARVLPLLPEPLRTEMTAKATEDPEGLQDMLLTGLGIGYGQMVEAGPVYRSFIAGKPEILALDGFDTALPERVVVPETGNTRTSASAPVALALVGQDLEVRAAGETDRFALGPALASIPENVFAGVASEEIAPLTVDLDSAYGRRARVRISYAVLEDRSRTPTQLTLTLLLRRADWPSLGRD